MHAGCPHKYFCEFTCMLQATMCEMTLTALEEFKIPQNVVLAVQLLFLLFPLLILWQQAPEALQLMSPCSLAGRYRVLGGELKENNCRNGEDR